MARTRITGTERKASILKAAQRVFAARGYEGAKTLQIAAEAKVSEALVYRHYPSKLALYRAVLRQMIRDQNANYEMMRLPPASTKGLVDAIANYLHACAHDTQGELSQGFRVMLSSIAGDGSFAGLVYRRAQRMMLNSVEAALCAAESAGDLQGPRIDAINLSMMLEHVGTMFNVLNSLPSGQALYRGDTDARLLDAIWFCCRGAGLTEAAIRRDLALPALPAANDA